MHILRFYAPGIPIHSFLKWYPKMYINNVGGNIANTLLKTIFIKNWHKYIKLNLIDCSKINKNRSAYFGKLKYCKNTSCHDLLNIFIFYSLVAIRPKVSKRFSMIFWSLNILLIPHSIVVNMTLCHLIPWLFAWKSSRTTLFNKLDIIYVHTTNWVICEEISVSSIRNNPQSSSPLSSCKTYLSR